MTVTEINRRVAALIALNDPDAAAAGAEELRVDVLRAIAEGDDNNVALAKAALRTVDQDVGGR